jgi:hypothetical protein
MLAPTTIVVHIHMSQKIETTLMAHHLQIDPLYEAKIPLSQIVM